MTSRRRAIPRASLFSQPVAWAEWAVGETSNFRRLQALAWFGGAACSAAIWVPASQLGPSIPSLWGLYLLAFVFATSVPLALLRALRAVVLARLAESQVESPAA